MTEPRESMLATLKESGIENFINCYTSPHTAAVLITEELKKKEHQIDTLTSLLTKSENNQPSIINKPGSKQMKNLIYPLPFFKRLRQLFCSHQTFGVSVIAQGINVYKGKEYLMYQCADCNLCIVQWEEA